MIACLRSSQFLMRDTKGKHLVCLDLRRLQDLDAIARGRHTRQFVVTRRQEPVNRLTEMGTIHNKHFDDLPAARNYWRESAMKLIDLGYTKRDFLIMGFHEED